MRDNWLELNSYKRTKPRHGWVMGHGGRRLAKMCIPHLSEWANLRKYALETPRERIAKICAPRKSYYPRMTPTCPTPTTDATYVPGAGEREGEKRRTDSAFGHKADELHTSGDTKAYSALICHV